jgi:hypothetical protein
MKSVAAGDEVRVQFMGVAVMVVADDGVRVSAVEVVDRDIARLKAQRQTVLHAGRDQVLDDLGLPVDGDGASARELIHRDAVALAVEAEEDATVAKPLSREPVAEADLVQDIDGPLLKDPGADPRLDVVAVARLEHDGVDTGTLQQPAEQQTRGTGADDRDLSRVRAHRDEQ